VGFLLLLWERKRKKLPREGLEECYKRFGDGIRKVGERRLNIIGRKRLMENWTGYGRPSLDQVDCGQ
jgi:hypothetical protein